MAPRDNEFWTHGVAAVVEFPTNTLQIQHNLQGTTIRQTSNTDNWLHLALPTAQKVMDYVPYLTYVEFRGEVNENARIDLIRVADDQTMLLEETVRFTDRVVAERFVMPANVLEYPGRFSGGLTLTIHVQFLTGTPLGRVVFRSGGATFQVITTEENVHSTF
jgi:hypothetical protein